MWSFTDCLVMVGGWDTATAQTGALRASEAWLGEWLYRRASGATAQAGKPVVGGVPVHCVRGPAP